MARDISKQAFGRLKAEAKRVRGVFDEDHPIDRLLGGEERKSQRDMESRTIGNYGPRTKALIDKAVAANKKKSR